MKLTNTPEEITAIVAALKPLHVQLFECKSCDPKHNAQRNLEGRTHYVDDDTLKWHKSRVASSGHFANGLLFAITTSDSLDMNNTKRGFRCVVFDLFGTTVYRPDLADASPTRKGAEKAFRDAEFDLAAHYREAIKSKLHYAEQDVTNLLTVAQNLAGADVVTKVLAEREPANA